MIDDASSNGPGKPSPRTAVGLHQAAIILVSYRMTDAGTHFKGERPVRQAILRGNSGGVLGAHGDSISVSRPAGYTKMFGSFYFFLARARPSP